MGVPKFALWLENKYPEIITDVCPPKVNGLYIDLNGIIHPCCHSDSDASVAQRSEEEMLRCICHEVEVLVEIVKPSGILYISSDGVAPRAKMNQQRARRYMSAAKLLSSGADVVGEIISEFTLGELAEVDDELFDVRQSLMNDAMYGGVLNTDDKSNDDVFSAFNDPFNEEQINMAVFDSNCISPGTAFMSKVTDAIITMAEDKLTSGDPLWAELHVVVSGSGTSGEGEHKIFDFLRTQSSYPGFNGKGAHVVVGLDADLIFLALALHIPHIFILRDNNKNKSTKKKGTNCYNNISEEDKNNKDKKFCLDSQSLSCGEDNDADFCTVAINKRGKNNIDDIISNNGSNKSHNKLSFESPENKKKHKYYAIDTLGSCLISELHELCKIKKFCAVSKDVFCPKLLVSSSGYHFCRHAGSADGELRHFLTDVGKKYEKEEDWQEFQPCNSQANSKVIDDVIVIAMLMGNDFLPHLPSAFCGESALDNLMELYITNVLPYGFLTSGYNQINLWQLQRLFESYAKIEAVFFRRFVQSRNNLKLKEITGPPGSSFDNCWREPYLKSTGLFENVDEACKKYVEGLCFVWRYYSSNSANCSWSWYYPFHHAPFALDIADYLRRCCLQLLPAPLPPPPETSAPDTFVQLLCILPLTSRALLPSALGDVMLCPPEELRDAFPTTWQVDFSAAYEKDYLATVLLPFADFEKLSALVKEAESKFTSEEQRRRQQTDYSVLLSSSKTAVQLHGDVSEFSVADAALFGQRRNGVKYMRLRNSKPERSRPKTYSCLSSSVSFGFSHEQGKMNTGMCRSRRKREKMMSNNNNNTASGSTVTVINKGPSFASYLIGVAVVTLLTAVAFLPLTSAHLLQVFAVYVGAITLSFVIGIAVHDPFSGSVIRRNGIPKTYVDWLCSECMFSNFATNEKCFVCSAPFVEEQCLAIFSGVETVTPPLYDPDHTQHIKTFSLETCV